MIDGPMTDERIRLREEVQMQIKALKEMTQMAAQYGCDISRPAENARRSSTKPLHRHIWLELSKQWCCYLSGSYCHFLGYLYPERFGQWCIGRTGGSELITNSS